MFGLYFKKKRIFAFEKYKNKAMKRSIIFLLALLPLLLHGQSVVYEIQDEGAEHSIVRHYKNKVEIVFDVLVSHYRFNLVDRGAGTTISIYLPTGMAVSDFRIEGDTVYFCGNYYRSLTNGGALVGWFSINDVFFNGGGILEYPYTSSIISTEVANSQYNWFSLHMADTPQWFILSGSYDDLSNRTLWLFDEQGEPVCTNTVDDPVG